jgi:hypothetical protein
MNHPDPKKHKQLSFVKSFIRMGGYILLPWNITIASIILLLSELVGVWEETV